MNPGGDAAEQIVRLSLEGVEVAAKISGNGAKNIGLLLYATLKQEQRTKGKARLTSMLKSGKELKVFTIRQEDLKKFSQEAKRYGVLYCVLSGSGNSGHGYPEGEGQNVPKPQFGKDRPRPSVRARLEAGRPIKWKDWGAE